ncbi:MAG: beta-N-acetylhexosaminidase [Kiritimatiellia bacterium]
MKRLMLMLFTLVCGVSIGSAGMSALVPLPVSVTAKKDAPGIQLTAKSTVIYDEPFRAEAEYAVAELNRATGFALKAESAGLFSSVGTIRFRKVSGKGPEAYLLEVSDEGVVISATAPAGAFYGFQTLRQLMIPKIYSKSIVEGETWTIPAVVIVDSPRMRWRGLMADECRHFMGEDAIYNLLDVMAIHKLNTLHWHLTDDQGWRIEIKKYPQIVLNGARREQSEMKRNRNHGDQTPYGWYYYTQDQIRAIVAYAAARHITIVPEIEMPGHVIALLSAFPDLSCTGGPFKPRWQWGVDPNILCAGNDRVFPFMEDILDEVMALFPSQYIHVGGDEAPKDRWEKCPKCQQRIKSLGLKNTHQLQSWFVQHFANYLEAHQRHLIGWDEILEGGLPRGAAVMSWNGTRRGIIAAKAGFEVVMAPNTFLYLDYNPKLPNDPYEYIGNSCTLPRVYSFNPTDQIPEAMHSKVIGVQGNLWSEFIWGREDLEWKAWPRGMAVAEIGWTPQSQRKWDEFVPRLFFAMERLKVLGINASPAPTPPQKEEQKLLAK